MEWSKIKTILIAVFVFVNLFLFVIYFKSAYSVTALDNEVVENTIEILKQNNVVADRNVMPKNHSNAKVCNVENKYKSVSEMLDVMRDISAKNGVDYLNEEDTKIRGNSFTCHVNENTDVSDTLKYTKQNIKKTGLVDKIEYTVVEDEGYVFFYLNFEDKIFYDSYIRVKTTQKGIQEIYGYNWLGDMIKEGGMAETVSPPEILIDFAVQMNFSKKVEIESIKSGYCIGDRDETVRVTAFPVWKIELSDGDVYYYDMRNGDLLE